MIRNYKIPHVFIKGKRSCYEVKALCRVQQELGAPWELGPARDSQLEGAGALQWPRT